MPARWWGAADFPRQLSFQPKPRTVAGLQHAFLMQTLLPWPWQRDCVALSGAFRFNALMNKAQAQGGRHQSVLTPALPGTVQLISPQSKARKGVKGWGWGVIHKKTHLQQPCCFPQSKINWD